MTENNKVYAMIYKRLLISDDKYIYLPCHIINGIYDLSDKSITDTTGVPIYSCDNFIAVSSTYDLTYYYDISEKDLLNKYDTEDISEAVYKYYSDFKQYILISTVNHSKKTINIKSIPTEFIEELLNEYKYNIKDGKEDAIITKAQLIDLLHIQDNEIIKKELRKILTRLVVKQNGKEKSEELASELKYVKENNIVQENITTEEMYEEIFPESIDINSNNKCRDTYEYISKYLIGIIINNMNVLKPNEMIKPLVIGQTGSGKTYFFTLLSKYLNVPFHSVDCNTLVQAGYEGKDVEDILRDLYIVCNKDIHKAEKAIVFLDEIDKLASRGAGVSDEGVQKALLKFIEGSKYVVQIDRIGCEKITIDTSNMIIVAGGAFETLMSSKKNSVGFMNEEEKETKDITVDQLIEFGMIRELIGRFGVIVQYNKVTKNMLEEQLEKSEDSPIKVQGKNLFRQYGIHIEFSSNFLNKIIDEALKNGTGFRGPGQIINSKIAKVMFKIQYEGIKNKTIIIDEDKYTITDTKTKKIGTRK